MNRTLKNPHTRPKNEWLEKNFANWTTNQLGVTAQLVKNQLVQFLQEDYGAGCVSIWAGINSPNETDCTACIIAKEDFALCGIHLMAETFYLASDGYVKIFTDFTDGQMVKKGDVILWAEATYGALLLAERVSLNLTSRLCGIATKTHKTIANLALAAKKLQVAHPTLLETRKTTPGLRLFEKYATRVGGARNHRHSLDSGAMLKENHLRAGGGIDACLKRIKTNAPVLTKVEVEVTNLSEFQEALNGGADLIMLDNFNLENILQAVALKKSCGKDIKLEVSGNLDRKSPEEICSFGVDFVSMGALIHQATSVDMSMQLYAN